MSSLFHPHGFRCKQYCRVFKIILCLGEDIMNVGLWDGFLRGTNLSSFFCGTLPEFHLFQ